MSSEKYSAPPAYEYQPASYPPPPAAPYPPATYPPPTTTTYAYPTVGPVIMGVRYGKEPVNTTCPNCHKEVTSHVKHKMGNLGWISVGAIATAGLVFLLPFFFCWIPCVGTCFKDAEHYCPDCKNLLGVYKRL